MKRVSFLGPYQGHCWTMLGLAILPDQLYFKIYKIVPTWSEANIHRVPNFQDPVRAIFGSCWDHVQPNFSATPASALNYLKQSQLGLRNMYMECLFFGTMSGPYLEHVGIMFGLDLYPDQLEL